MGPTPRDPRGMTDEEAMEWMQKLVKKLEEEKGSAGGACSLEAVKNPVRRGILNALEERALVMDEISERVGVAGPTLKYHLNFLQSSYFIWIEGNNIDLTPGGVSFVRSSKRT